jgi:hypothetical protein
MFIPFFLVGRKTERLKLFLAIWLLYIPITLLISYWYKSKL